MKDSGKIVGDLKFEKIFVNGFADNLVGIIMDNVNIEAKDFSFDPTVLIIWSKVSRPNLGIILLRY